jgi:asparagine synthase (glutamine-hydrolysing)
MFFYIYEWIRRQVVASLSIFRTQVEIRMPYLDEDFLKMLLKLPINMRYEGELQIAVVKYFAPALLKIPNSNTGAPLDAGKWRLWIIDKWNSLLKRLRISGYRHYTEFERWQRRYFKEKIKQIIFDQRTLGRGIYNPDGLKEVFYAHVTNKKNYARLLGTIVGLELWYRNFVD